MSVHVPSTTTLSPQSPKAVTASLIFYAGALGLALYWYHWDNIYKGNRDSLSRRATQALEMKVLKARLDHFSARRADGEVLGEAEVEEAGRMEALLGRWFRCVEEDAVREDGQKARSREGNGWLAWLL
ncbi:hypothetical protein MMC28_008568 [Mycoblastus sanguinarius]|nr:hypothetical protein [Mycoblastus sanguinarius]